MAQTIQQISEEFSKGNFASLFDHFSDTIQWNIIGDKTIEGKMNMVEFCNKMLLQMAGSHLNNIHVLTEGNHVAIEGRCNYTNQDGSAGEIRYADFYVFKNEKIERITSYCLETRPI